MTTRKWCVNTKIEFGKFVKDKNDIKCARIRYWPKIGKPYEIFDLAVGYTMEEYSSFLDELNFTYDGGYGIQHIYGHIWFCDGTWGYRKEYDGSESWQFAMCPDVPDDLKK